MAIYIKKIKPFLFVSIAAAFLNSCNIVDTQGSGTGSGSNTGITAFSLQGEDDRLIVRV